MTCLLFQTTHEDIITTYGVPQAENEINVIDVEEVEKDDVESEHGEYPNHQEDIILDATPEVEVIPINEDDISFVLVEPVVQTEQEPAESE